MPGSGSPCRPHQMLGHGYQQRGVWAPGNLLEGGRAIMDTCSRDLPSENAAWEPQGPPVHGLHRPVLLAGNWGRDGNQGSSSPIPTAPHYLSGRCQPRPETLSRSNSNPEVPWTNPAQASTSSRSLPDPHFRFAGAAASRASGATGAGDQRDRKSVV